MTQQPIAIDYTSKDYAGFKFSMLEYASRVFPDWQSRSEGDFGIVLVELFAYMGDILSVYGDRMAQEAYLSTATQRASLVQISNLLGYVPSNGVAATGTVSLKSAAISPAISVPAGTQLSTDYISAYDSPIYYETVADVIVPVNGGTVLATVVEGVTLPVTTVGTSTGLADQAFRLPNGPVLDGSVRLFMETSTGTEEWQYINFLVDADPQDKVFTTLTDGVGATYIQLGDGVSGLIPASGLILSSSYRVGGGSRGNRLAGTVTQVVNPTPGLSIEIDATGLPVSSVMAGGADQETVEQIRKNAPRSFRTQNRLVTTTDYKDAALGVPGVSRASALSANHTSMVIYITGPNSTLPTAALKTYVINTLTPKSMTGTTVTCASPSIIPVNIGSTTSPVVIGVLPKYSNAVVSAEVTTNLQSILSGANIDFGMRLSLSAVYQAIISVQGVAYTNISMFARSDFAQSGTADIQFRNWEIPSIGNIVLSASGGI